MKPRILSAITVLALAVLACGAPTESGVIPTLAKSPFGLNRTMYGFFPSPADMSTQSAVDTYQGMGQHADVALIQQAVPWKDFQQGMDVTSQAMADIHSAYVLAHQNGLDVIFVVDPLNGLNRREFANLPSGWQASFANPQVRYAYTNFTMRIVQDFHPRYLGLASEINTYQDTHPDDFPYFLSLYRSVYGMVKSVSPDTQIFVTFQWEELNNLIPAIAGARKPYQTNWNQIEEFEPTLDVWAISTYPFIVFPHGADIKADYYSPLLARTTKPLAVAEGGYPSQDNGVVKGTQQDQVDYLEAIHTQIGSRLTFWIYLLYNDLDVSAYAPLLILQGQALEVPTFNWFATLGLTRADHTPKAALAVWDSFRQP